jgi:hypothetical protein
MRKLFALALAGGLLIATIGPVQAKPVRVMEDAAGDAGNQDSSLPGATEAGLDLVGATIDKKGKNLEFTVEHAASMPNFGHMPEAVRFMWHFSSGKKLFRFTFKSFDIGKPDVLAGGTGTERIGQVYATGVARLETCTEEATPAITLINCSAVAYLDLKMDPAKKTFTIIAPLKDLKAKPGTPIAGGTHGAGGSGCMLCWVPHYAERSLTPSSIIDSAAQSVVYKVPK